MKITKKLLISFIVIVILYLATVFTALYGVRKITGNFDEFYNKSYQIVKESMDFRLNQYIVARDMLLIVNEKNTETTAEELKEAKTSMAIVDQAMENLMKLNGENDMMSELKQLHGELVIPREKVMTLLENEKYDDAMKVYQNDYSPKAVEARSFLRDLETETKKAADAYYLSSNQSASVMLISLVVLSIVTLLLTSALWFIIARSITKPIQTLKKAAKDLSNGNLHTKLEYHSQDELGSLADSMRETITTLSVYVNEIEKTMLMIGKGKLNYQAGVEFKGDFITLSESLNQISSLLSKSMLQIANSAEQVSGGAQQISNGAQMLSQGASEQAGSIEELATSINEISENVKNNADDTVAASELADVVENEIVASSQQMDRVTEAIEEIKQNSMDITGIVKDIEDIAFQTNLLSLNAAVEAARAGDAGRGFSVVASEIRKLATKTTEASKTTAELIKKSTTSVEEGSTLISSAEQSMKHVVEGAREVANKIERISQSNIQQANFIIQIRQSIGMISDIVQGNSATSEESAAASEELAAQAQLLRELANKFELRDEEGLNV
ncbi:methyl-accepting chemotaxis protein [[Eubacterium] hominis]|uniref:methyl-accepting chemotaxis protein n=1 Tax=[Eubacterium] hominis TaxID=2764325 RepID=UPI0022E20C21